MANNMFREINNALNYYEREEPNGLPNVIRYYDGLGYEIVRSERRKKQLVKEIYENPKTGMTSADNIYQEIKDRRIAGISRKDVRDILNNLQTYQIHMPLREKATLLSYIPLGIAKRFFFDLIDMKKFATPHNGGKKYLLTIVDDTSKYLNAFPITSRTTRSIMGALNQWYDGLDQRHKNRVEMLVSDNEFRNSTYLEWAKDKNIKTIFTKPYAPQANIVERYNKTLKQAIFRYMTAENTKRYIDVLEDLLKNINNRISKNTHNKRPVDVWNWEYDEGNIVETLTKKIEKRNRNMDFLPLERGDKVRIPITLLDSKARRGKQFRKKSDAVWSREIFEITKVVENKQQMERNVDGRKYILKNAETGAKIVDHQFRRNELLKVNR